MLVAASALRFWSASTKALLKWPSAHQGASSSAGNFPRAHHSGYTSRSPLYGKQLLVLNWWLAMGRGMV